MTLAAIDLFAGVGGLSLGFKQAGFNVVLANEYDQAIAESYSRNHPGTQLIVDDIENVDLTGTFRTYSHEVDIVVGGPPCQGFSQKGQRRTIHDQRNYLFKNFVKVVEIVRPKFFLMENVPNLLTAEQGLFKREVLNLFGSLGYEVTADTLNAADYGVPQNRRRAFILGKYGSSAPTLAPRPNKQATVWNAISDLAYLESGEGTIVSEYRKEIQSDLQRYLRQGSTELYNHVATKHSKTALERMSLIPPRGGREDLPPEHHTKSIYSGTWGRMDKDDRAVTITTRFDTPSSGRFTHPFLNRAITVREAARLQSFPDTFRFYGTKSSQMQQVGNAVPPLLARHLAASIRAQA